MLKTIAGYEFEDLTDPAEASQYHVTSSNEDEVGEGNSDSMYFDFQWLDSSALYLIAAVDCESGHFSENYCEEVITDSFDSYPTSFLMNCCDWFADNNLPYDWDELESAAQRFQSDINNACPQE